jgi:hypothetical protein
LFLNCGSGVGKCDWWGEVIIDENVVDFYVTICCAKTNEVKMGFRLQNLDAFALLTIPYRGAEVRGEVNGLFASVLVFACSPASEERIAFIIFRFNSDGSLRIPGAR